MMFKDIQQLNYLVVIKQNQYPMIQEQEDFKISYNFWQNKLKNKSNKDNNPYKIKIKLNFETDLNTFYFIQCIYKETSHYFFYQLIFLQRNQFFQRHLFQVLVFSIYNNGIRQIQTFNKIILFQEKKIMKNNESKQQQFINPYRQNKRWFSKYLSKPKQNLSAGNDQSNKNQQMLDGISKASSIKIQQTVHQELKKPQKSIIEHLDQNFMIYNKRKNVDINNPQLFDLVSKHLQSDKKINHTHNKIHNNHTKSSSFKKMSKLSPAPLKIQKLQKIPKITQFIRQTFHKNISTSRNHFSSKKQSQDNLHCKSDLNINTKKISILKKTKTNPDRKLFYTYEIYSINMRIGIMVQILAGSLKQIKFRLILNQNDTKTFNKFWKIKPQQFIQKCLIVNELGISLKVGRFNEQNPKVSRIKTSRIKQLHKSYLQNQRQSIVKKQQYRKLSAKKIGSKFYSQQYDPQQVQKNDNKEKQNPNDIRTQLIQQKQTNIYKISQNQQIKKQENLIEINQSNNRQQLQKQMQLVESFVTQQEALKQQDIIKQEKNQSKIIQSQSKIFQTSKPQQIIVENSIG